MPAKKSSDRDPTQNEMTRLLWDRYRYIEIDRPDMGCNPGTCTLAACLTDTQLAVLRQLVMLPLQLAWSPFDTSVTEELWLLLFGDEFTVG